MPRAAIAILLLFVATSASAAEQKLPAEAREAIDARDWKAAVPILTPLAKDASNEPANYWLGAAHHSLGQHGKAVHHLKRALKANPMCRPAAVMLARSVAELSLNDTYRVSNADPALEACPVDPDVLHWVGRAWMNKYFFAQWYGEAGEALKTRRSDFLRRAEATFRLAAALRPGDPAHQKWLAFALLRLRRYEEAAERAAKASSAGPGGWETYLVTSSAMTRLGRHAEAAQAFARARSARPALGKRVDFERGRALLSAGRFNEACESFCSAIRADKGYPFARHWLARSAVAAKDYGLAMWALKESHELDAKLIDDSYWAGRCAYGLKKFALAEKLFAKACAEPRRMGGRPNPDWIHYLGRARWALGKKKEAYENLTLACERRPRNLAFARWLFAAYVEDEEFYKAVMVARRIGGRGHAEEAARWLEAMLEKWPQPRFQDLMAKKYPHARAAMEMLGHLRYFRGRFFEAGYCFGKARCTKGRYVRTRAGWAFLVTGRTKQAETVFRNYLAADPVFHLYSSRITRHTQTEKDKDYGRFGLGAALAARRRWDEAYKAFDAIQRADWDHTRKTGLLWSAIGLKKNDAPALADPYTLLGLMANKQRGRNRGAEVLTVIPGSLLDGHEPRLRADDRILRVGDMRLGGMEQLKAFRESPIPDKPVKALVRRGEHRFEITVDYPAAVKKLPPAPGPEPEEGNP
ncbi:MAG: tetratricopeptide repeat protein [Planctomycetota bacterium]